MRINETLFIVQATRAGSDQGDPLPFQKASYV